MLFKANCQLLKLARYGSINNCIHTCSTDFMSSRSPSMAPLVPKSVRLRLERKMDKVPPKKIAPLFENVYCCGFPAAVYFGQTIVVGGSIGIPLLNCYFIYTNTFSQVGGIGGMIFGNVLLGFHTVCLHWVIKGLVLRAYYNHETDDYFLVTPAIIPFVSRLVKIEDRTLEGHPLTANMEGKSPLYRSTITKQTFIIFRDSFITPKFFTRLLK